MQMRILCVHVVVSMYVHVCVLCTPEPCSQMCALRYRMYMFVEYKLCANVMDGAMHELCAVCVVSMHLFF